MSEFSVGDSVGVSPIVAGLAGTTVTTPVTAISAFRLRGVRVLTALEANFRLLIDGTEVGQAAGALDRDTTISCSFEMVAGQTYSVAIVCAVAHRWRYLYAPYSTKVASVASTPELQGQWVGASMPMVLQVDSPTIVPGPAAELEETMPMSTVNIAVNRRKYDWFARRLNAGGGTPTDGDFYADRVYLGDLLIADNTRA